VAAGSEELEEELTMRNLLACLAAFTLITSITGWCRAWYTVESAPSDLGKMAFRVEVDQLRIASDAVEAVKAARRLVSSSKGKEAGAEKSAAAEDKGPEREKDIP